MVVQIPTTLQRWMACGAQVGDGGSGVRFRNSVVMCGA